MARKRNHRMQHRRTPLVPVTFSLQKGCLDRSNLIARQALDALLSGAADDQHVATMMSVAMYSVKLAARLQDDQSADEAELLRAKSAADEGLAALRSVIARRAELGRIGCSGAERQALIALADVHEAIDTVATRRQSRDAFVAVLEEAAG